MLLRGHEGPHIFTPDDEIGVEFIEAMSRPVEQIGQMPKRRERA